MTTLILILVLAYRKEHIIKIIIEVPIFLIILINSIKNLHELFIDAVKNITYFEKTHFRHNFYLWASKEGGFFNPFDRGIKNNLIQLFLPFFSASDNNKEYDPKVSISDIETLNSKINLLSSYDGSFNPNWHTINIYTVLEIKNCKVRDVLINEIEKHKKKQQKIKMLKEQQKVKEQKLENEEQNLNKEEKKENENNEKVDNNENIKTVKEDNQSV